MREEGTPDGDVRAQAADWFARLKSVPISRETLEEFRTWRKGEGHSEAFEAVERFWSASGSVGDRPAILAATQAALGREHGRPTKSRGWRGLALAGAGAVVAALVATVLLDREGEAYETRVGQQSVITLEDGSKVALDTDTKLVVLYAAKSREVRLEHGQALFTVAHARERPFTVAAGDTRVLATGTQFEVSRQKLATEVTLVEGSVRVSDAGAGGPFRLVPGQQARLASTRPAAIRAVNVATATAWSRGRIVFDAVPLEEAVSEVNRYTSRPIRLDSARYAGSRLSGSFETGDIDGFVAAAAQILPIRAERDADGSVRLIDTSSDSHK